MYRNTNRDTRDKMRTQRLLDLYGLNPNLVYILWTRSTNKFIEKIVESRLQVALQKARDSTS